MESSEGTIAATNFPHVHKSSSRPVFQTWRIKLLEQDLQDNRCSLPGLTELRIEAPLTNENKVLCEYLGVKMVKNNFEATGFCRLLY